MKKTVLRIGFAAMVMAALVACQKDDNSSDNNGSNNNNTQPPPPSPSAAIVGTYNGTLIMDVNGGVSTTPTKYYIQAHTDNRFKIITEDSLITLTTASATVQGQILTANIPQQTIILFGSNPNKFEGEGVNLRYDNSDRTIRIQYKQDDEIAELVTKFDFTGTRQ